MLMLLVNRLFARGGGGGEAGLFASLTAKICGVSKQLACKSLSLAITISVSTFSRSSSIASFAFHNSNSKNNKRSQNVTNDEKMRATDSNKNKR